VLPCCRLRAFDWQALRRKRNMEEIRIDRHSRRRMKWWRTSEEEGFLVLKNPDII
jgi:hypothetical protein